MIIIGIAGKKGAGKDVISDMFVRKHKYQKVAFADPLKEMLSKIFRLESKYFYDEKLKEKSLPERITLDYYHLDKIREYVESWNYEVSYEQREKMEMFYGDEITTPRQLMQIVGTDIVRKCIKDDFWIDLFFLRIRDFGSHIIVSDVRLKNERDALKKAGAHLMLIERKELESKDNHISENDLGKESDYEVVIRNNDITLQVLESEVMMWYSIKVK